MISNINILNTVKQNNIKNGFYVFLCNWLNNQSNQNNQKYIVYFGFSKNLSQYMCDDYINFRNINKNIFENTTIMNYYILKNVKILNIQE
jgi:hypothetical protein